jgi:DNA-binding GntR family transcriptional regulator
MIDTTQSLSEQAYRIIEEMIVTLALAPGTLFTETDLAEQIGIGRTPVREALKQMAVEQLVVSIPRRGIMVTEINITDHLLLLETRRALDSLIARRAARRATSAERAQLQAYAEALAQAVQAENLAEYIRIDYEFDGLMAEIARNQFATTAVAPLHVHSRRFWTAYKAYGDWSRIADLHVNLMEQVVAGDEAQAGAAAEALVDYLDEFTRKVIEEI